MANHRGTEAQSGQQDWTVSPCCNKAVYNKGDEARCSQCQAVCPQPAAWLCWNEETDEGWEGGTGTTREAAYQCLLSGIGCTEEDVPREGLAWRALPAGLSEAGDYELYILTNKAYSHGCSEESRSFHSMEDIRACLAGEADEHGDTFDYGFWNSGEDDWTQRTLLYGADALRAIPRGVLRFSPELIEPTLALLAAEAGEPPALQGAPRG